MVKTLDFQSGNRSSILRRCTMCKRCKQGNHQKCRVAWKSKFSWSICHCVDCHGVIAENHGHSM